MQDSTPVDRLLDEARLEELGLEPLAALFRRIAALQDKSDVAALIAHFNSLGLDAPYRPIVHQGNRDATRYIVDLRQSGLDRERHSGRVATERERQLSTPPNPDAI